VSRKQPGAGSTPATLALVRAGIRFEVHAYEHDPAAPSFGLEAAAALDVSADRVFKTLCADLDGRLCVGIVPVTAQLDLKALAAVLGGKRATMAAPADAERATGYVVGGISPIGQKRRLPTVLDDSAGRYETVFVSAGRRGLDLELRPADLLRAVDGSSASIARS
jgi:Cys-tRNA(Pro)/Cys-tRNA(Cys) deacylase